MKTYNLLKLKLDFSLRQSYNITINYQHLLFLNLLINISPPPKYRFFSIGIGKIKTREG